MYPSYVGDRSPVGYTVIDLLPGGVLLENPFWHVRVEPVDGSAAVSGQTGYMAGHCSDIARGYMITGYGKRSEIIFIQRDCSGDVTEVFGHVL